MGNDFLKLRIMMILIDLIAHNILSLNRQWMTHLCIQKKMGNILIKYHLILLVLNVLFLLFFLSDQKCQSSSTQLNSSANFLMLKRILTRTQNVKDFKQKMQRTN